MILIINQVILSGSIDFSNLDKSSKFVIKPNNNPVLCTFNNTEMRDDVIKVHERHITDTNLRFVAIGYSYSNDLYNHIIVTHIWNTKGAISGDQDLNMILLTGKIVKIDYTRNGKPYLCISSNNKIIQVMLNNGMNDSIHTNKYITLVSNIGRSSYPAYADNVIGIDDKDLSQMGGYSVSSQYSHDLSDIQQYRTEISNALETKIYTNMMKLMKITDLSYKKQDLLNFYTAMKNHGMVILSGISGTGKTSLVNLYAEAMGLNDSQFLYIPVRPYWNDDSDLLGYFDISNSAFYSSNTGLVDLLQRAADNPHKLYVVLFDEMNLARIEHYFSQFLSILELPAKNTDGSRNKNRCIKLYNTNKSSENNVNKQIYVGNNILFVGTINTDESTYKISDKVLDRSNTILLAKSEFTPSKLSHDTNDKLNIINNVQPMSFDDFQITKYENMNNSLANTDDQNNPSVELDILNELNNALYKYTYGKLGIGWRIVKQINEYLCDIPTCDSFSMNRDRAFDYQLSQRILNKISGTRKELIDLIGLPKNKKGKLKLILNDYSKNSDSFRLSKQIIERKAQEIEEYGFTL